ncbi:hypothetical protein [Halorubrum sp. BV1]|uniref:hypothetical protein n=1 Tax=Halorubrum sp. BV1 TaxID=1498500 RepID=UPI00067864B0|nr:hypothetical protein [Halorubrum sp. BV1]
MDPSQYRDAVAANRRKHGFDALDDDTNGFDSVWKTRDDDASVGDVVVLATVVDDTDPDPTAITARTDEFRDVLVDRIDGQPEPTTPLGYVAFPVTDPDPSLVDAARSYTVARRRTNVFPLVYDCASERLHRHEVPRLKGRGIYRRQAADAERLFDV